jgi:hypothetical protein
MKPIYSQSISALEQQPRFVDRRRGAQFLSERFFPVSHRTLESWPLAWRHVNGHAVCELAELVAVAEAKLAAAAPIRSGSQSHLTSKKINPSK